MHKVVTPVKTGVQENCNFAISLDSGFRRNDEKCLFGLLAGLSTFQVIRTMIIDEVADFFARVPDRLRRGVTKRVMIIPVFLVIGYLRMRGEPAPGSSPAAPIVIYRNPGVFSMGGAFLVGILVSLLSREPAAETIFDDEKLRAYVGIGAE